MPPHEVLREQQSEIHKLEKQHAKTKGKKPYARGSVPPCLSTDFSDTGLEIPVGLSTGESEAEKDGNWSIPTKTPGPDRPEKALACESPVNNLHAHPHATTRYHRSGECGHSHQRLSLTSSTFEDSAIGRSTASPAHISADDDPDAITPVHIPATRRSATVIPQTSRQEKTDGSQFIADYFTAKKIHRRSESDSTIRPASAFAAARRSGDQGGDGVKSERVVETPTSFITARSSLSDEA